MEERVSSTCQMSLENFKTGRLQREFRKLQYVDETETKEDAKIQNWIRIIGKSADADRVYVYFFTKDENGYVIANNTHEYCKKGIPSAKNEQQNIPIDLFPFYKNVVYDKLEYAWINSIDELSEEAKSMKELMEFQGLKSILAIPIAGEKQPIGFIGFETIKKEKQWKEEHLELLKVVSELILSNKK